MEIKVFFKDTKTTLQNTFFFFFFDNENFIKLSKKSHPSMQEEYVRDKYNQTHKLQATTLQNLLHNSFFL